MIKPNYVLVLDADKKPLTPCKPSMAAKLLKSSKAAVYRRFPFVIILKKECNPSKQAQMELKIDPGSQTTGVALVQENRVIWVAELNHLRDAAVVNSTRWKLFNCLEETGISVTTGTGGQTKYNRQKFGLEKTHFYDAACVGQVDNLEVLSNQPLIITCKGHGGRQKAALNKYGYPIRYNPLKPIKGWQSGDLAIDNLGNLGRVNPRSKSNSFNFTVFGQKAKSIHVARLKRVHQKDGYTYTQ